MFKKPTIYLISEGTATPENFAEKSVEILESLRVAAALKIPFIQIREKHLPARLIFELSVGAVNVARNTSTKIIVNDRADIALAAKAHGVHLTSQSMPTGIIRQNFPKTFIIGVSSHSLETAATAKEQGANFVTFGPIFKTPSKEVYGNPQGLRALREVCRKLKPLPVIALGGIDETNFRKVLGNGANGFAAIRFLNRLIKDGMRNRERLMRELRDEK